MNVRHNPAAPRWRGVPVDAKDFSVSLRQETQVVDSVTDFYTNADVVMRRVTGTASTTSYDVSVAQNLSLGPTQVTNLTPGVMELAGRRVTGTQYSATGRIRVRGYAGVREYDLVFPGQAPTVQVTDDSIAPGTLAAHCMDNLLGRLAGKVPGGTAQNVFQEANHGYTLGTLSCSGYNQSSILAGLDLACVQFASSRIQAGLSAEHRVPSLLVGPRHVIAAYHAMNYPGERMFWRRNDGSFAEAVVVAVKDLGADLGLAVLDRDVTGIQYARVLPQNWPNKLKAPLASESVGANGVLKITSRDRIFLGVGLTGNVSPGLGFVRHAQLFGFSQIGHLSTGFFFRSCGLGAPAQPSLSGWYSTPYGGDSNSPVFLVVNQGGTQTPVFVSSLYTAATGPSYGAHVTMIDENLNQMSVVAGDNRPFALQTADLSAFPDVA